MSEYSDKIVKEDIKIILEDLKEYYNAFENKRILIVGGKGFLGTYFVKTLQEINNLIKKPCKIIVIDNLITSKEKNLFHDDVDFLEKDISDEFSIEGELDYIIHAASIASPPVYRKFPIKTVDVNYQGTRNLLELAKEKKISGMLYLSSSEIYGDPEIIPTPESYLGRVSCIGPRACYDESKRLGETISILYHQQFNVPVKIVRPFNIYGPYLSLDDGRIIPDFMKSSLNNSEIIIHSDGKPTRSFCYVSDAIRAFFRVLMIAPPGSICNVGNDKEEISVKNTAELIKKIVKTPVEIKFEKSNDPNYVVNNPQRRCPDLKYIKKTVGYKPQISLKEGLGRVYVWYSENLE
tara:strand:- start:1605 stop:2654 length:1050 start_codon:yes stop_codon:yes gene_type:complete